MMEITMTNLLLSLLLLLTGSGIGIFLSGKAELKRDFRDLKDAINKLQESNTDLQTRLTRVETQLEIE